MVKAIGLMSGTSLDGIDVAYIQSNGQDEITRLGSYSYHYDPAFIRSLRTVLGGQGDLSWVEDQINTHHIQAVEQAMASWDITKDDVDIIGFHGQTIDHRPKEGITVQIGDGQYIADTLGIDVVYQLRQADIQAAGEGAPLAPIYHQAMLAHVDRPAVILNVGGVANLTYVDDTTLLAFDTGPGNALLNDWVCHHTGDAFDKDGMLAKRGVVDASLVDTFLQHDYFKQLPPKSLDRNDFNDFMPADLSPEDGAATLLAYTVESIALAQSLLPNSPNAWYVSGGGRHNAYLMQCLRDRLHEDVESVDVLGYDGDMVEAEAFAYLAIRSRNALPITFPLTTGVKEAMPGGVFCPA